jgi:Spy/CpxP family protein refolding chaperone
MRLKMFLIGAAVASLVISAVAQQPGQPGRGAGRQGGGMMRGGGNATGMLLQRADVQKELNLTEDQKTKIRQAQEKRQAAMQELRNLSPEERQQKMQELMAGNDLTASLNDTQKKRLKELEYQWQGPTALTQEENAKAIGLTQEQRTKIAGIQEQMGQTLRESMQGFQPGGDMTEVRKKLEEVRNKTEKDIEAVLTAEQKQKWQQMLGKAFTFEGGRGMGFGGGFGGRGGFGGGQRPNRDPGSLNR